jgi:hypothetical protein
MSQKLGKRSNNTPFLWLQLWLFLQLFLQAFVRLNLFAKFFFPSSQYCKSQSGMPLAASSVSSALPHRTFAFTCCLLS